MGPSDMGVRMDIDIETVLWLAIGGIVVIGVIGIVVGAAGYALIRQTWRDRPRPARGPKTPGEKLPDHPVP